MYRVIITNTNTKAWKKKNSPVLSASEFDKYQMDEIRKGLESGVDVSIYADPKYDGGQMQQIWLGLKSGIDVSVYADPKYDWTQMKQIRIAHMIENV